MQNLPHYAPADKYAALRAWRHELACGERTPTTYDWLWRAACWEAAALEAERTAHERTVRQYRRRARAIVAEAARAVA